MINRMTLAFAAVFVLTTSATTGAELRCDRFHVRAVRDGDQLTVSLDTDCPDFTVIMISVYRSYYQKGSTTAYVHSYFDERSTVGKWRRPRRISIAHSKWISALNAHRRKMNRMGLGYTVARIDEDLQVSMVLPVNQKDKRFGRRNENLVGKAMRIQSGLRTAESEVRIPYSLRDGSVGTRRLPGHAYSLELGQSYYLAKQTPLAQEMRPADPMAALKRMKYIPAGYAIKIIGRSKVYGTPWYKVIVKDRKGSHRGSGWINSTALLGQELELVRR